MSGALRFPHEQVIIPLWYAGYRLSLPDPNSNNTHDFYLFFITQFYGGSGVKFLNIGKRHQAFCVHF